MIFSRRFPVAFLGMLCALFLSGCPDPVGSPPPDDVGDGAIKDAEDVSGDDALDATGDGARDAADGASPDVTQGDVPFDVVPGDAPRDVNPDAPRDVSGDGGMPVMMTPPRITRCPGDSLPAPATGTCTVTAGNAAILMTGDVLTPGEVLRGGQVLVDAMGVIQCVGCDCSTSAGATGATRVVCPDGAISPGLINAHDHLTFAQNSPYTVTPERYEHRHDWRRGARGHTRLSSTGSASNDQVAWGELRFVLGGATSVNGSGGVNGFLRNLDRANMEGLGQPQVQYQTFPLGDSGGETLTMGCMYPAIDTAASIARVEAYTPHVAEGIGTEARNEFLCIRSGANDLVQPQSAFIHGVGLLPPDIAEMAHDGTALIWSPRSNVTLYGDTARVIEYARLGVPIGLGSDWIISGSMNMLRELRCADGLNRNFFDRFFTDESLWLMATRDAAASLGVDDAIGILAVGRRADIAVFNAAMHADHRAVIDAEARDVVLVLRGGTALYGDANVIAALPGGAMCDALDVCGTAKSVCVSRELGGRNLAALSAANSTRYPLFFCGEPMNEPSCLPARNAMTPLPNPVVNGSTRYAGMSSMTDMDGDGIPNAMDNCARVFNPVRPVDNMRQADFDMDGLGDSCDPCPLNAGTTVCTAPDPNDRDADGTPNARDNCPDTPNPTQSDRDMDQRGDMCDPCPDTPNPGTAACPATIYAIKNNTVAVGSRVTVTGSIVTAVGRNGFYMQVDPASMGYMGVDFSGVFVYTGAAPALMVGDRVTVADATVADFFGQKQLSGATVTATASGVALPAPAMVAPMAIATGGMRAAALEGVLVSVQNVVVTNVAPAPAGGEVAPTNEFEVAGVLRVDDALFLTTPFPVMSEAFAGITGVLAFSRDNSKLLPRSAADIVAGAAQLLPFPTTVTFARVGTMAAPTLPEPLTVRLTRALAMNATVTFMSSAPGLTIPSVVIPAGQASAVVPVQGVTPSATPYTVTATLGTSMQTARVRVIGATEAPRLASLTPAMTAVAVGALATFTVEFDIPAPPAGATVTLSTTAGGTVPMSVTVPANRLGATFDFTAGAMAATSTVTATLGMDSRTATVMVTTAPPGSLVINEVDYDQVGTDAGEFIELYNGGTAPVDLSQYAVVLVNGSTNAQYLRVALTGMLAPGAYAVVANTGVMVPAGVARFMLADNIVQNGAPDGVALINTATMSLVDALSYEGAISAATVPGVTGMVNLVEGTALPVSVADSNTAPGSISRLPNGTDSNNAGDDWDFTSTPTPGAANVP
jgi:imidazolonepropionase-like amidohydrolase